MTLAAAHQGYEYQDLLVVLRLVDVMLGSIEQIRIDEKLVPNDRFDDLTIVDTTGRRERIQVEHTCPQCFDDGQWRDLAIVTVPDLASGGWQIEREQGIFTLSWRGTNA